MKLFEIIDTTTIKALSNVRSQAHAERDSTPTPAFARGYIYNLKSVKMKNISQTFLTDLHESFRQHGTAFVFVSMGKPRVLNFEKSIQFAARVSRYVNAGMEVHEVSCARGDGYQLQRKDLKPLFERMRNALNPLKYAQRMSFSEEQRIRENQKREARFYDIAQPNIYRKPSKRGYRMAVKEARESERVSQKAIKEMKTIRLWKELSAVL